MYLVSHNGADLVHDQWIMCATQHQCVCPLSQQRCSEVTDQLFAQRQVAAAFVDGFRQAGAGLWNNSRRLAELV